MTERDAITYEFASISRVAAEAMEGSSRFAAGAGRHGAPV
jgi:enoyl-CoA hydratase